MVSLSIDFGTLSTMNVLRAKNSLLIFAFASTDQ